MKIKKKQQFCRFPFRPLQFCLLRFLVLYSLSCSLRLSSCVHFLCSFFVVFERQKSQRNTSFFFFNQTYSSQINWKLKRSEGQVKETKWEIVKSSVVFFPFNSKNHLVSFTWCGCFVSHFFSQFECNALLTIVSFCIKVKRPLTLCFRCSVSNIYNNHYNIYKYDFVSSKRYLMQYRMRHITWKPFRFFDNAQYALFYWIELRRCRFTYYILHTDIYV